MMRTGVDAEAEMRAVRTRYDEWTWQASEELNRRFSDREIAGQLRAGRYRAILSAALAEYLIHAGGSGFRGAGRGRSSRRYRAAAVGAA